MRNLTIQRRKRFVGCLGRMKVYIEDSTANEISIDHITCRKLGVLKNGEEKTFSIEDSAAKVFMIADKLSKNYCNEYYQLPEGQEDIFLSGQNSFNPATGNAFRFDNNDTPDIIAHRKRNTRKGLPILIAAFLVGFIIGYVTVSAILWGIKKNDKNNEPPIEQIEQVTEKSFSDEGLSITLTNQFKKTELDNAPREYTVIYSSEDVAVFALKEGFELLPGSRYYTLDHYLELVLEANDLNDDYIVEVEGLTSFVYDKPNPETLVVYRYYSYVYKADDAFWMIQFTTPRDKAEQYKDLIIEWAKSVTFPKEK